MLRRLALSVSLLATASALHAQTLSPKWEELTAPDFVTAIHQSQNTCVLPFGILEKHGPHLPLGTDLLDVRFAALNAVKQEYAVVFPEYYFGQIFEAQQEPGTVAYSLSTQLLLLQETVKEMARNGCKKILIVNGHGGRLCRFHLRHSQPQRAWRAKAQVRCQERYARR
jgi:creatinine amidohydrolase